MKEKLGESSHESERRTQKVPALIQMVFFEGFRTVNVRIRMDKLYQATSIPLGEGRRYRHMEKQS